MDTIVKEFQGATSTRPAHGSEAEEESGSGPPSEVMTKLQYQLEKVQRDIQIQQRQTQRQPSHRFRSDSRRGSDSDRLGRGSSIGFKPNTRLTGVRPRAIDPTTCAPWGHPGDIGLRGQSAGWLGYRLPRMQQPRPNCWQDDRMPQMIRPEGLNTAAEVFRDWSSPVDSKPPVEGTGHQWNVFSHQHRHLFPPLVSSHPGQRSMFGPVARALVACPRPGIFAWPRPLPRQVGPTVTVARADRPESSPYPGTSSLPKQGTGFPWQHEPRPNTSEDGDIDRHGANSNEAISKDTRSEQGHDSGKDVVGKSHADDLSQKTDASHGEQKVLINTEKSSPARKYRSSSGPKTPPGLQHDESFDFSSILGDKYSWHRLFLEDLSFKPTGEKDYGDPFDEKSSPKERIPISYQLETIEEKDSGDSTNAKTNSKCLPDDGDSNQYGENTKKNSAKSKSPKTETLDLLGSKKGFDRRNNDPDSKQFNNSCERSMISNTDENNNLPSQLNANFQNISKEPAALLQEKARLKCQQKVDLVDKNTRIKSKSPPMAFVSPFQYAAYQRKSDRRGMAWRHMTNPDTTATSLNLRDTSCPKCHDRLRWPHLLVCCHRLCFPCLATLFDEENNRIQCPYCRSITKTDPSLKKLVLDLHKCREMCSMQISPFVCTVCKKNKHADTACRTCPGFLCGDCQQRHKNDQDLSTHTMEPVKNVGYNQDGELHPMCAEHPGVLYAQFCVDCSTMVCSLCLQQTHAGHELCDLASAKQIAERRFREMNCGLMDMIEHCQNKLQNFNLSKQKVEGSMKVVRNNIHKACNQMISYIEMFEKASKNLADKVHSAGMKHLNGLIKEANKYDEERETFEEFCTRYIVDSRPEELTPVLPLVHQQLECLRDFYTKSTLLSPNLSVDLKFDPVYPEFNEAMSRMFSELRFEHNVSLESLLNSSLGDRAVLESVQPQPYDRAYQSSCESGSGSSNSSSVKEGHSNSLNETASGDDLLKNFIRQTTACKYVFGQYGRGEYEFAEPSGICYLHNNSLAVCDAKNHRIMVYDENCKFSTIIGQPANLPPLPASANSGDTEPCFNRTPGALFFPFRLAQCPVTHNLVIVERPPSTDIQVFSCDGNFIRSFGNDCLKYPRGITVNESGQILVIESRTMKVFIFTMEGVKLHAFYLSMHLEFPNDIAAKAGNIFISDNRTHCVHVYDYNLEWQRQIGHESLTYFPIGVAVNHLGQVVVADNHNTFNITVFNQDGSFVDGFKSQSKHANCYSVALHPGRAELAVTTKECKVVLFDYNIARR